MWIKAVNQMTSFDLAHEFVTSFKKHSTTVSTPKCHVKQVFKQYFRKANLTDQKINEFVYSSLLADWSVGCVGWACTVQGT